ncbi:MAG: ATP-binding protein [Chlamydiae bacterium]|nr:ATP-binding protein [Chlamydiota bacterium]
MTDILKKEVKKFPARLETLYDVLEWARERISKYFSEKDLNRIELVIEEAFVNIMNHAYKDRKGKLELSIEVDGKLEIIFKDKGSFFNPVLHKQNHQENLSLEERKIGGLGLVFIKKYMDEIQYIREEPYNILILRKKIIQ